MGADVYAPPCVQVTDEEYNNFFKQTFKEFLEPQATSHFNVEGTIEFTAMLFVPGMAPFEQQVRESACSSCAAQDTCMHANSGSHTGTTFHHQP